MNRKTGYKATFEFFRMLGKLKLIERKKIDLDMWRSIGEMLRKKRDKRVNE